MKMATKQQAKDDSNYMLGSYIGAIEKHAFEFGLVTDSSDPFYINETKKFIQDEWNSFADSSSAIRYEELGYPIDEQFAYLMGAGLGTSLFFHAGQYRKLPHPLTGRRVPSIMHSQRIASSCEDGSFILKSIALTHDTIEDNVESYFKDNNKYQKAVEILGSSRNIKEKVRLGYSLAVGIKAMQNLFFASNMGFIRGTEDNYRKIFSAIYSQMRGVESLTREYDQKYTDYLYKLVYDINAKYLDEKWDKVRETAFLMNSKMQRLVSYFLKEKTGNIEELIGIYREKVLLFKPDNMELEEKKNIRRRITVKLRDVQDNALTTGTLNDFGIGDNFLCYTRLADLTDWMNRKLNKIVKDPEDYSKLISIHEDVMNNVLDKMDSINSILKEDVFSNIGISEEDIAKINFNLAQYPYTFEATTDKTDNTMWAGFFKEHINALNDKKQRKKFYKKINLDTKESVIISSGYLLMWYNVFSELIRLNNDPNKIGKPKQIIKGLRSF